MSIPPLSVILTLEDNTNQEFKIPKDQKFNVDGKMVDAFALRKGMKVSATKIVEVPTVVSSELQSVTGKKPPAPPAHRPQKGEGAGCRLRQGARDAATTCDCHDPPSPPPDAPCSSPRKASLLSRPRRNNPSCSWRTDSGKSQTTFFGLVWPCFWL